MVNIENEAMVPHTNVSNGFASGTFDSTFSCILLT